MRSFLLPIAIGCALAATAFAHPDDKNLAPVDDTIITLAQLTGSAGQTFQTVPNWGEIPDPVNIGPTHGGIVLDKKGNIYVSTDGPKGIHVFSPDGKLIRTMAPEFSGIHGVCIREENGEEFIYAAHLRGHQVLKLTLDGKAVLTIPYPQEADAYPEGKGYSPTGVAVAPNGDIFVVDGYGKSLVHKFDAAGKWLKTFGGKGKEDGQFMTCHGIVLDTRSGTPLLLICDRENRRLVHLDLEGNFVATITTDLRRPCSASIHGDFVAIAELEGRVTILDKTNQQIAHLGDNPDQSLWAKFDAPPEVWKPGIFTAPHGISYDAEGNLYVQDWNKTGRVSKLVKATAPATVSR